MRTSALRRFTPLPKTGKRAEASRRARYQAFGQILARSRWRCEGCGASSREVPCAWHHTAGRPGSGMCLGQIADSAELTTALCMDDPRTGRQGCHSRVHANPQGELAEKLLRDAYIRLGGKVDGVEADAAGWRELIRQAVREREAS